MNKKYAIHVKQLPFLIVQDVKQNLEIVKPADLVTKRRTCKCNTLV